MKEKGHFVNSQFCWSCLSKVVKSSRTKAGRPIVTSRTKGAIARPRARWITVAFLALGMRVSRLSCPNKAGAKLLSLRRLALALAGPVCSM